MPRNKNNESQSTELNECTEIAEIHYTYNELVAMADGIFVIVVTEIFVGNHANLDARIAWTVETEVFESGLDILRRVGKINWRDSETVTENEFVIIDHNSNDKTAIAQSNRGDVFTVFIVPRTTRTAKIVVLKHTMNYYKEPIATILRYTEPKRIARHIYLAVKENRK